MKKMEGKKKRIGRTTTAALIVAIILGLVLSYAGSIFMNKTSAADDITILYFMPDGNVFEKSVETGTAWEDLGLPTELRAVVKVEKGDITDGFNGVVIDENADTEDGAGSYATNSSLAANGVFKPDETIKNETANNETGENDNNAADRQKWNVPVTWTGVYNDNEPGEYMLTAQITGYKYSGEMPFVIITVVPEDPDEATAPVPNSISGFFWVDSNGDLDTDWDGLYNGDEQPLANYPVKLFNAGDFSSAVATTRTDLKGKYIFKDLEPGSYVLEIRGEAIDGIDYLAPIFITSGNKFAIDWSASGLPAYTEVIELAHGQEIQDVDAGLRLPMEIARYKALDSLAGLKTANKNDTIVIQNRTWVVVKRQTVNGVDYVYLIMRGTIYSNEKFGSSVNYDNSDLRSRMKKSLDQAASNKLEIIHAIAVKPILGNHGSTSTLTLPTPEMAWPETQDILFAPSIGDMRQWATGDTNNNTIPRGHPLHFDSSPPFPTRFWSRTYRTSAELYGHIRSNKNVFDQGLMYSGTTIVDIPAVWVNPDAVNRKINIYHVNERGEQIAPAESASVLVGNSLTLTNAIIKSIAGYSFKEYKKNSPVGASEGKTFKNPTLSSKEVIAGTDIYLIYEQTAISVTVNFIDKNTKAPIDKPVGFAVNMGGTFTLDVIPAIAGYQFAGEWETVSAPGIKHPPVIISNVVSNTAINLYYTSSPGLTITKTVQGENDPEREFAFRVFVISTEDYPTEPGQLFVYERGVIDGSGMVAMEDGSLMLDEDGMLNFKLKHGQAINIKDIHAGYSVVVSEMFEKSDVNKYETAYSINGGTEESGTYAFVVFMDGNGMTVDFVNTRVTGITISKRVHSELNIEREFTFTVSLFSSDPSKPMNPKPEYKYVGGILEGSGATAPPNGSLELKDDYILTFKLKHGQTITIRDVEVGHSVVVAESEDTRYITSYSVNGEAEKSGVSTGYPPIPMSSDGIMTIDFVNERKIVVPTGIMDDPWTVILLAIATGAFILSGLGAVNYLKRRAEKTLKPGYSIDNVNRK